MTQPDTRTAPDLAAASPTSMTMRDYFAAAVITGMCAGPHHLAHMTDPTRVDGEARLAYAIADAMILARG